MRDVWGLDGAESGPVNAGPMMMASRTDRMPKTPSASDNSENGSPKHPKRRRRRRLVRVLFWSPVILMVTVLILGQTPVMKVIVEPIVSKQIGMDMSAGSIRLLPTGKVVVRQAEFIAPGVDGEAARVLMVKRAVISMDWWATLMGSPTLSTMVLDGPEIRLSQSNETGKLNFADVVLATGSGGDSSMPAVRIVGGIVEIGEHDASGYSVLKRLRVSGETTRPDEDGVSSFHFAALPATPSASDPNIVGAGTLVLTGTISDEDGVQARLEGFRLEDWPASIVPSRSRAIYERLALAGELASTKFSLASDGDLAVVMTLDGVELNLPFDENYSMTGDGALLRMRDTRGTIRFGTRGAQAKVAGFVDELRYDVQLEYAGLSADSPFVGTIRTQFALSDDFRPRQFLPPKVVSKLDRFDNLALDVDATVRIERSSPTDGGGVEVSGNAAITNGTARYKKFPYPFTDLHGVIRFDSTQIIVENIQGVGPTGAKLTTNGLFAPLGEMSKVVLNLDVTGLTIDDGLKAAMSRGQQELVEALFSEDKYAALLGDGLLLTPSDHASLIAQRSALTRAIEKAGENERRSLAQQLASVDELLTVPVFEFGGSADVSVVLRRHPQRPSDSRWTTETSVRLAHAGLVPKHFPLPIIAKDVNITINDDRVELTGGRYEGISGGWATVDVQLDLKDKNAVTKPMPLVEIKVREIPIDARLVAAIPGYRDDQGDDPDAVTLRRILDRLRLTGTVECDAVIGPRTPHALGYDIEAMIVDGTARPLPMPELFDDPGDFTVDPLTMGNILGTIYLTEEMIVVSLDGDLYAPDQPLAPTPMHVLTQLTMPARVGGLGGVRREGGLLPIQYGPPVPGPQMYVRARADGLDLAMPLEHAIAVVSPATARSMSQWRTQTNPDGVLGVQATLNGYVGGAVDTTLTLDRIEHLALDLGGQRYRAGASWGNAILTLGTLPHVVLDGFRVPLTVDGQGAGELTMDGQLSLARGQRRYEPKANEALDIVYTDGRFGSSLVRAIVGQGRDADTPNALIEYDIDGLFDLTVRVTPRMVGMMDRGVDGLMMLPPMELNGRLDPKSLSFSMNDRTVDFSEVTGTVLFAGTQGTIEGIHAAGEDYSLAADGDWAMDDLGFGVDLTIDAVGGVLDSPLRAVVPRVLDQVLENLQVGSKGPVDIAGLEVWAQAIGTEEMRFRVDGRADILGGYATIGMPLTEMDGSLDFVAAGADGYVGYEIDLDIDWGRAGTLGLSQTHVYIVGDASKPGVVLIPEIEAMMYGGRIAGSAQIRPTEDDRSRFWAELHCSGVRAAPLFDDLLLPPGGLMGPPLPGEDSVRSSWDVDDEFSRGVMIADLSMSGIIGDPSGRTGRGLIQISGGSVVALPGILNLIEASNLNLPVGSKLEDAEVEFYIAGDTLAFERLSAMSKSIEILGYGTMDWVTRVMDLRFRSRSLARIPLLSTLIEGLRDELITTKISGVPGSLTYSVDQFGSTKRVLNALLGRPETDHQRRLREVEQRVDASRSETKNPTSAIVHESVPMDGQWGQWVDEESPEK